MKKPKQPKYNKAIPSSTIIVDKGDNWFIARVRNGSDVEFQVYIDNIWMADHDTKEEAQVWRDEYVYNQLQHNAVDQVVVRLAGLEAELLQPKAA